MELASLTGWNTTKYTKYVNEGSAWVDEKEDIVPIGGAPQNPGNQGPLSKPFFFGLFAMLLLLLAAVQYSKTHKKISVVQS
jgi:hypothetical protein